MSKESRHWDGARRHIAVFTTDLYQGGVAESTRKLVNVLAPHFNVDLLVYDNLPINHEYPSNVRVFRLCAPLSTHFAKTKIGRMLKKAFRVPLALYVLGYVAIYKISARPDVLFSLTYIPNIINVLTIPFYRKTRAIISERQDPRMDLANSHVMGSIVRLVYPKAFRIHVNSPGMVRAVEEYYGVPKGKVYRLDNFFFSAELHCLAAEKLPAEYEHIFANPVVVSVGRLSRQKGHWHFIRAIRIVRESRPDVHAVIIGEGELRGYLESMVSESGLSGFVHFLGNVKNPHKFVARSCAFVFPSIWESFGNSLVEAMAVGVPVLATSCRSGPGDIIAGGKYGIDLGQLEPFERSFEGGRDVDPSRIARSLLSLLGAPELHRQYCERSIAGAARYDALQAGAELASFIEQSIRESSN